MRNRIVMAALAGVFALAGCGGGDDEEQASGPSPTVEAPAEATCEKVPASVLATLNSTLADGAKIERASAVKSADFSEVWFIAGPLTGPGLDGKDLIVFATNSIDGPGLTYGVGGFAHQFSDLGHGEDTDAKFSQSDHGFAEAKDCAKGA